MNDAGTPSWAPDTDRVVERLTGLLGREGVSEDYVRLRIGVFKAQAAALAELGDGTLVRIPAKPKRPGPMLEPNMVRFDAASAERLFGAILRVCREHGDPGADLSRVESGVRSERGRLESLIRRAAFGPDQQYLVSLAERLAVRPDVLLLLGRLLAAPFVTCAVGHLREHAATGMPASEGPCPACGSTPGLASLRPDDGRRVLHCSLCGHGWPVGRLVCPFCADQHQSALAQLAVAGEEVRWIEACDACRHYLPVIDRRGRPEGEPFIPLVEEVAGLYLGFVAEQEGYLRSPPYAAVG